MLEIIKSDKKVTNGIKCNLLINRIIFDNFALINSVNPNK